MKFLNSILLILISTFFYQSVYSQAAIGGCDEVTVTEIPSYPTVYFAFVGYKDCKGPWGPKDECCRVITRGNPTTPKFWLEQLKGNEWETIGTFQFTPTFNNLEQGTYRVRIKTPDIAENKCKTDKFGNVLKSRIFLYNLLGQFIGYWGTWDNTPFGGTPVYYTNEVIVGATTEDDISYTFIDIPETGSEQAYDFGEYVRMNTSESKNYDFWNLAVFEDGPTHNRFRSAGWNFGAIDEFDLSYFWDGGAGWEFETFHAYTVQFVVENYACRNGVQHPANSWNNLNRTFFICPTGSGCRFGIDEKEIIVSPNPASTFIKFNNFDPASDLGYRLIITDLSGKTVKQTLLESDQVDISDLPNGMFVVSVIKDEKQIFNTKLVINH